MTTLIIHGEIASKGFCSFDLALTPASRKALKKHQGKFKSPIKQDLLKLKQTLYTHGKENLTVGKHVSVTVKISFYKYSSDSKFTTIVSEGISLQPILVDLKVTAK